MNILAVIPARKGSKGLPGKNSRKLEDRPLWWWSYEFTRFCTSIGKVILSSDDEDILNMGCYADVRRRRAEEGQSIKGPPLEVQKRPALLCEDETPIWEVLKFVLSDHRKRDPTHWDAVDAVALLEPTSPIREPETFEKAVKRLAETPDADGIVSVREHAHNPLWNNFSMGESGFIVDLTGGHIDRRQDTEKRWAHTGEFYIWRPEAIEGAGSYRECLTLGQESPRPWCDISIDDNLDWTFAEIIMNGGVVSWKPRYQTSTT